MCCGLKILSKKDILSNEDHLALLFLGIGIMMLYIILLGGMPCTNIDENIMKYLRTGIRMHRQNGPIIIYNPK
jgi:hypothetical protein